MPLVKTGGIFLAMKGARGREEAAEGAFAVKQLGGEIQEIREGHLSDGDARISLIIRKQSRTPQQYPRPYARIKKKPLLGQGG
jgi:16S rRNA (guanine527-N7)-methyltransferase